MLKKVFFGFVASLIITLAFHPAQAEKKHGLAMHGEPKYPKDFNCFDGVNPNAPKGGNLKLAVIGTFDSTNPYINKGTPPAGISLYSEKLIFEPLMKRSPDEPLTQYGLIAESIEVAPDRSWIIFHLRPEAKWSDGTPLTADDVIFSHAIQRDKGRFNLRSLYQRVEKSEKLSTHSVKFTFKKDADGTYDAELPIVMGMMNILPKHIIEKGDFEKNLWDPVIGSGPYRVKEMSLGKYIIYERRPDYWGKDLTVNKGLFNFDTIRYDFYLDSRVAFEAFKAGNYDFRAESDYPLWVTGYDFKAVKEGKVKKLELEHKQPVGMKAFVFNTRKPYFADRTVRKALFYAFDFEWLNKNLLHNAYTRTRSFFDNTELANTATPKDQELKILNEFKDKIPSELFVQEFNCPQTDASGKNRENLKIARELLKNAGWVFKNNKLVNAATGKPFVFEILLYSKDDTKTAQAYARNLKLLGITANIRVVDPAQFENRRLNFDFDMIIHFWGHSLSPGNEQKLYWNSVAADTPASRNYAGAKDPVIDELAKRLVEAKTREDLVTYAQALDRVLVWGYYVVPLFHQNKYYIAYWDKINHPKHIPGAPLMGISCLWSKDAEEKKQKES